MAEFIKGPRGPLQRAGRPIGARLQGPDPLSAVADGDPNEVSPQDTTQDRLVRVSRKQDKFYVDPSRIPDGWSYEWKRMSVYGQPDPDHMLNLKANHWKPVPLARHPELAPGLPVSEDETAKCPFPGAIIKDGQVLMERPAYLTIDAQQEDYDIAIDQVRRKEREVGQAPVGTFSRSGHPSLDRQTGIRRSFERPMTAED